MCRPACSDAVTRVCTARGLLRTLPCRLQRPPRYEPGLVVSRWQEARRELLHRLVLSLALMEVGLVNFLSRLLFMKKIVEELLFLLH